MILYDKITSCFMSRVVACRHPVGFDNTTIVMNLKKAMGRSLSSGPFGNCSLSVPSYYLLNHSHVLPLSLRRLDAAIVRLDMLNSGFALDSLWPWHWRRIIRGCG